MTISIKGISTYYHSALDLSLIHLCEICVKPYSFNGDTSALLRGKKV